MTNKEVLVQMVKNHDWWYMMADDIASYSAGQKSHKDIMKLIKEMGDEGKEIYNNLVPKENFKLD